MPISEATYERVALEDPYGKWELIRGQLQRKPPMTFAHQDITWTLADQLRFQLSEGEFAVGQESPKLCVPSGNYRIPDVCVVPRELIRRLRRAHPDAFGVLTEPVSLVVEVWSPSTGGTDLRDKLAEYQQRGDLEIWYIRPYERTRISTLSGDRQSRDAAWERGRPARRGHPEPAGETPALPGGASRTSFPRKCGDPRTLTAWRRQPDGSYQEARYSGGAVTPASLARVVIELDTLFIERSPAWAEKETRDAPESNR